MATNVIDVKQIDKTGLLSPDVFSLLESQEIQVSDGIKTLIQENLSSTKEAWLVHSLVDYYYMTQSYSVVDILCAAQEPHDKNLLEKLHDGIKSQEHQLNALQLLLHIVCKQPLWINKIVKMSVLKVILKCLKTEISIPVLTTGVTIVTVLLPSIPTIVGPYLPDLFEIFNKLASFSIKKPSGNTPDIFYLHLQISVYALFHRLYGMFPYTFLAYLRQHYTKKENVQVFEDVIKGMLERVRLHPSLIIGNREQETSTQRWRQMETSEVVVECNRMSLDPVEGTWEELQCPIITSRYMSDRSTTNLERHSRSVPPLTLPSVSMATTVHQDQNQTSQDTFWSPSEVIGLSTPPTTPAVSSLETSLGGITTSQYVSPAVLLNAGTPLNTPRETPPISEEHDRSRASSRGVAQVKLVDPKRLSSEFPVSQQTVPLLTPSSNIQSVPPSPLKAEFTNTPPLGVKTLPVINAARELQFDHDHSDDKSTGHVTRVNQSQEFSKSVVRPEPFEIRPPQRKISEGQMNTEGQNTPKRSGSATMFEDSLKESSQEVGEITMKVRTQSVTSSKADTVSVDTISQVIEELETQPSHDEDSDDEVSELTSSSRSHGGHSAMLTSESVKKFMKNVNRIRFNSLTATNSIEPDQIKGFSTKRSRSCPQFPKIESTMEEDEDLVSRSVSVTCQNTSHDEIDFIPNIEVGPSKEVKEVTIVPPIPPADNMCDISISSTGSMVTVNKKQEPVPVTVIPSAADIPVPKCPVYSGKSSDVESIEETHDLLRILKQVLNMPSGTTCAKCQGQVDGSQTHGSWKPFFSTFSPPELLDRHISLGKDIHAKELSKLPMPSSQEVNWTHFGGMPPADEVSILRGQLMLLHNQLMYERHKRDQHAKRNRRLLRKIANTKTLEEQNNSMSEQLKQNEAMIRDMQVSLKLLQEENHKLKSNKDSEEYEKLVQLRSCLQENEDLKNVKKEFNTLLVRQREEQDSLNKRMMATEAKLFNTEKELEKMREVASQNTKLKEQVLKQQKEVLLMGELQQKCNDKLLANKSSKATKLEHEHTVATLQKELKEKTKELGEKTVLLESCQHQLSEQQEVLSNKETALSDFKSMVEKIKTSHEDELKCVEDKHIAATRINQALESQILQLYMEIEEVKAKVKVSGGLRPSVTTDIVTSQDDKAGDSIQEFRERTSSDPLQQSPTLKKKTLTRMTSLPVSSDLGLGLSSAPSDLHPPRSPNASQRSTGTGNEFPPKQTMLVEEEYDMIEAGANVGDMDDQHTVSDATSLSSRDSSLYPGQRNMLYTDSEDNRSASNRSSNMGDSGFA